MWFTKRMVDPFPLFFFIFQTICTCCRCQWPRCVRRGPTAAHLLGLWDRIPPGIWMSVSCEDCILSGRGLCIGPITRPEKSCRVWCVWVCSRNIGNAEALAPLGGCCAIGKKNCICLVAFRCYSLLPVFGNSEFNIFLRHLLVYTCRRVSAFFVLIQVSHPQSGTSFIFLSKTRDLLLRVSWLDVHSANTWMNEEYALLMRFFIPSYLCCFGIWHG
jgi:hypothetical protein